MKQAITFGTSGHRGLIGSDFTQKHVWAIAQAVADYLEKEDQTKSILVAYDPRHGNSPKIEEGSFTRVLVESLHSRGIETHLCETYTPTPVLSWAVRYGYYGGGLILTASHNPPEYNGIKFNPNPGQPAPVEVTTYLEQKANRYFLLPYSEVNTDIESLLFKHVNPIFDFAKDLIKRCEDLIQLQSPPSLPVAVDCKHGACASTWNALFKPLTSLLSLINSEPLPTFGKLNPNPTYFPGLNDLKKESCSLSFANDPDGDRHVILDEKGTPLTPELTTTLIADYLLSLGHSINGIASTLASSGIIKAFAKKNQIHFEETKVGFKYFYPFLKSCHDKNELALAVESSGGFSISSHTYEKCGFLPCLLVLYICSHSGQPLSSLITDIINKYGNFHFSESSFTYDESQKESLKNIFKTVTSEKLKPNFKGLTALDTRDGVKLIFENSWLLFRFSGTEPLIRLYAESLSKTNTDTLLKKGTSFLLSLLKK
jgi:phosphoglucomutase